MIDGLVSVCCVTYNHERFVKAAIDSIFQQTYRQMEIIVIDDGSKDRTFAILEELRAISPFPMRIETQTNTGRPGFNSNRALQMAQGEYIRFLSLDDVFIPESTAEFMKVMVQSPDLQFVCADRTPVINDDSEFTGEYSETPFIGKTVNDINVDDMLELENSNGGTFFLQNVLFRKSVLDACGGYDEELIGDDISLRVRLFQYMQKSGNRSFQIITKPGFMYRVHANNLHKNSDRQVDTLAQICKKYFDGKPGPALMAWLRHSVNLKMADLQRALDQEFVHQNDPDKLNELNAAIHSFRSSIDHYYLGLPREESAFVEWSTIFRTGLRRLVQKMGVLKFVRRLLGRTS